MERETIYRGRRFSKMWSGQNEWVYGYYLESHFSWKGHKPHKSWIINRAMSNGGWLALMGRTPVIDETVGQYTGLKDTNGKMIFEGDIFDIQGLLKGVITWHPNGYWCINDKQNDMRVDQMSYRPLGEMIYHAKERDYTYTVIGNIHEKKD